MRKALTGSAFRKFIAEQDESDMLRIQYCYQIGSTFVVLGLMESTVIDAMGVCDRIKVANVLESVREHHAGLQSLRSMRRIEARRRKASALQLRFSQSLASRRQRFSQAMVRSTIQRFGKTTNPFA